jgi:hypothetical protein
MLGAESSVRAWTKGREDSAHFYFYFLFYFSYILGAKNSVREQLGPPFKGREDFAPLDVLLHTAGLQPPALNLFEKGGGKELISPADVYI